MTLTTMYGVYRVTRSGENYVPRSATTNEKLAKELAEGFSSGEITMPDGSIKHIKPVPHIYNPIGRA